MIVDEEWKRAHSVLYTSRGIAPQIHASVFSYIEAQEHARLLSDFWIFDVKLRSANADNTSTWHSGLLEFRPKTSR